MIPNFLSHFNGIQNQTTYIAETDQTCTFDVSAKLDATQAKFGTTSLLLPGSSLSCVKVPDSSDWWFSSGDFTIDCWAYLNENTSTWAINSYKVLVSLGGTTTNTFNMGGGVQWMLYPWKTPTSVQLAFGYAYASSSFTVSSSDIVITTGWHHYAATKSGTNLRVFFDGQLVGTKPAAPVIGAYSASPTRRLLVGIQNGQTINNWKGWIDEVRIMKGEAAWTSTFTPSNSEYPNPPPLTCWNFTAKYKNSKKFFKLNGAGNCPESLEIPSNIDLNSGVMIEHGKKVDYNRFKIL